MDGTQPIGHVSHKACGQRPGQRAGLLDARLQGATLDVLKDQAGAVDGGLAPGVGLDGGGVVEPGEGAGVIAEGGKGLLAAAGWAAELEELEGNEASQGRQLAGEPDLAEEPLAEPADQRVLAGERVEG